VAWPAESLAVTITLIVLSGWALVEMATPALPISPLRCLSRIACSVSGDLIWSLIVKLFFFLWLPQANHYFWLNSKWGRQLMTYNTRYSKGLDGETCMTRPMGNSIPK